MITVTPSPWRIPFLGLAVLNILLTALALPALAEAPLLEPRTVILMIGDGMGSEHIKAGRYYLGTPLAFESLPHQATMTTYSADNSVTDSAASGTAIATGHKVNNGVISMALPGDGAELQSLLEYFAAKGRSTGLVSTTYMTHATPAAFGAHAESRANTTDIADDYRNQSIPDVLLGGGANGLSPAAAQAAGYTVVTTAAELQALDTGASLMVSGQFGSTHLPYEYDGLGALPHLREMTAAALQILSNNPNGFFLMIEGGRIDHAAHANDIKRCLGELAEFDLAVQEVLRWAQGREDVLLLVTADHETGGLSVIADNGPGKAPTVAWTSTNHSSLNVPLFAWGYGAEKFSGTIDNTEIFENIVTAGYVYNTAPSVDVGADQAVVFGAAVRLSGSVIDDGIAQPMGSLNSSWSQVSGPGLANFQDASAPATSVEFSRAGTYVLQLSADDGLLQSSADVTIKVKSGRCGATVPDLDSDGDGVLDCIVTQAFGRRINRALSLVRRLRAPAWEGHHNADYMQEQRSLRRKLRRRLAALVSMAATKGDSIMTNVPTADVGLLSQTARYRNRRLTTAAARVFSSHQKRALLSLRHLKSVLLR